MAATAGRVYSDPAAIARLEALIPQLPNGATVVVSLRDGGERHGVVAVRPMLQVFIDPWGDEGCNGVLRLKDPLDAAFNESIWLDQIERVAQHPSPTTPGVAH